MCDDSAARYSVGVARPARAMIRSPKYVVSPSAIHRLFVDGGFS